MDVEPPYPDPRDQLRAASARHRAAVIELDNSRKILEEALHRAAVEQVDRAEVIELSDYSREGTRKALRRIGVGPAKRGRRHAASASKASASST